MPTHRTLFILGMFFLPIVTGASSVWVDTSNDNITTPYNPGTHLGTESDDNNSLYFSYSLASVGIPTKFCLELLSVSNAGAATTSQVSWDLYYNESSALISEDSIDSIWSASSAQYIGRTATTTYYHQDWTDPYIVCHDISIANTPMQTVGGYMLLRLNSNISVNIAPNYASSTAGMSLQGTTDYETRFAYNSFLDDIVYTVRKINAPDSYAREVPQLIVYVDYPDITTGDPLVYISDPVDRVNLDAPPDELTFTYLNIPYEFDYATVNYRQVIADGTGISIENSLSLGSFYINSTRSGSQTYNWFDAISIVSSSTFRFTVTLYDDENDVLPLHFIDFISIGYEDESDLYENLSPEDQDIYKTEVYNNIEEKWYHIFPLGYITRTYDVWKYRNDPANAGNLGIYDTFDAPVTITGDSIILSAAGSGVTDFAINVDFSAPYDLLGSSWITLNKMLSAVAYLLLVVYVLRRITGMESLLSEEAAIGDEADRFKNMRSAVNRVKNRDNYLMLRSRR